MRILAGFPLGLTRGRGRCSMPGTFPESESDPAAPPPPPLTPIRGSHLTQGESQVGSPRPLSLTSSPTVPHFTLIASLKTHLQVQARSEVLRIKQVNSALTVGFQRGPQGRPP